VLGLSDDVAACLSDLDGVLTDAAAGHERAWTEMVDARRDDRAERVRGDHAVTDLAERVRGDLVVTDLAEREQR
jgi:beta-phosphoglucomutase-like phosphatase (HAD superfamily)